MAIGYLEPTLCIELPESLWVTTPRRTRKVATGCEQEGKASPTRIGGRSIYLGKHGSPASYQKFAQVAPDVASPAVANRSAAATWSLTEIPTLP